jgi:hypothetical protein
MLPGLQKNVRESTLTLPTKLPFWELKSQWIPEFSEGDCKGRNPLDWIVFCIIRKILRLRCLKWACMTHLDTWNISYGQKKSRESNRQFDSRPLKVGNRPNFLTCKWCETYCCKALNEGYNFALDLISIGGLYTKLWGPKFETSCGSDALPTPWRTQMWVQVKDSGRRRSREALPSSQHFEG